MRSADFHCALCSYKKCATGLDCSGEIPGLNELINKKRNLDTLKIAARVERECYMKNTRLEEIIRFCNLMEYEKVGIAFCIGLSDEARVLEEILGEYFEVVSVCCKIHGMDKEKLSLPKLRDAGFEASCNPIGQALLLNRAGTDFNLIVGLCVGHDALFTTHSEAPVSTFIVKDRVLAHNPAGVVYSGYYRKKLRVVQPTIKEMKK